MYSKLDSMSTAPDPPGSAINWRKAAGYGLPGPTGGDGMVTCAHVSPPSSLATRPPVVGAVAGTAGLMTASTRDGFSGMMAMDRAPNRRFGFGSVMGCE